MFTLILLILLNLVLFGDENQKVNDESLFRFSLASRSSLHASITALVGQTTEGRPIEIYKNYEEMSRQLALRMAEAIAANNQRKKKTVLVLFTGSTAEGVNEEFLAAIRNRKINVSQLITFNLDENVPPDGYQGDWIKDEQSYRYFMDTTLLNDLLKLGMKPENIHFFNGQAEKREVELERLADEFLEARQEAGSVLAIGGMGSDGHFAFIEPRITITRHLVNFPNESANQPLIRNTNEYVLGHDFRSRPIEGMSPILKRHQKLRDGIPFEKFLTSAIRSADPKRTKKGIQELAERLRKQTVTIYIEHLHKEQARDIQSQIENLNLPFEVELKDTDEMKSSLTYFTRMDLQTVIDNSRFEPEDVSRRPLEAYTMNRGIFLLLHEFIIAVHGVKKRNILPVVLEKAFSEELILEVSAAGLRTHKNGIYMVTEEVAVNLDRRGFVTKKMDAVTRVSTPGISDQNFWQGQSGRVLLSQKSINESLGIKWARFPSGEKILVLEEEREPADIYVGNEISAMRDARWGNTITSMKFTDPASLDLEKLAEIEADVIIAPDRNSEVDGVLQALANQHPSGGIQYLRYTPLEREFIVDSPSGISEKPNLSVGADATILAIAQMMMERFVSQNERTEYRIIQRLMGEYASQVAKIFVLPNNDMPFANNFVVAEMTEEGDWVVTDKPYRILFGEEAKNYRGEDPVIRIVPGSKAIFGMPHTDDVELGAVFFYLLLLANGVDIHTLVQDANGRAVLDTNALYLQKLKEQELEFEGVSFDQRTEIIRVMKDAIRMEELENSTQAAQSSVQMSEHTTFKGNVRISNLEIVYGKNKDLSEEEKVQMILENLKAEADEHIVNVGRGIPIPLVLAHPNDAHHNHVAYTARHRKALKLFAQDPKYKGIRFQVPLFQATWSGDANTYFHSESNVQVEARAGSPLANIAKAVETKKEILARVTGELTALEGFGKKSPPVDSLGGRFAERVRRGYLPVDQTLLKGDIRLLDASL